MTLERWIVPSFALTFASGGIALAILPVTGMINAPDLYVLPLWMALLAGVGAIFVFVKTIRLAAGGVERPILYFRERFDWRRAGIAYLGCFVAGLNLGFFGWVKPQLGHLTPFAADAFLADVDKLIFTIDPWRLLTWMIHPGIEFFYHQMWFVWLAGVLIYLFSRPPSVEKDSAIVSYFLLWSIFGPLVHLAIPAAGPIFFDEVGLGDRFAGLVPTPITGTTAYYLWDAYVTKQFAPGGGISAMPSLHIATMVWSVIVLRKTRWLAVAVFYTLYIFAGSIALGWHYSSDGLVGGLGAIFCYGACRAWGRSGIGLFSIIRSKLDRARNTAG